LNFVVTTPKKKEIKEVKKTSAVRGKTQTSATSAAILGNPSAKGGGVNHGDVRKIKPEWQKFYTNLLELREQLLSQMSGLAKESAQELPGYSLHMADSGTDNFDRDFALSLLSGPGRGVRDRRSAQAHRTQDVRCL
jgi:hypothetical protein